MQPIHSVENRQHVVENTQHVDYVSDYKQGPAAETVVVLAIVVALLVGAIFVAGAGDTSDAPREPVLTEAPIGPVA